MTTRLGPKPVLIAKPPPEAVETREVARGDGLMSSDPAPAMLEVDAEPTDSGMFILCLRAIMYLVMLKIQWNPCSLSK